MCFRRWTSFLAALALALTLPAQALALDSLREQRAADSGSGRMDGEREGAEEQPEAAAVSAKAAPEAALLDGAALGEAQEPGSQALDAVVEGVLEEITAEDMSTYEQVKACYDYVLANTAYGNHMAYMSTPIGGGTCWDVYQSHGEVEGFGAVALTAGKGMCNAYASAFILMARHLGLDARLVKGSTMSGGGGYAYHEWAEILIGGTPYVFDPQLDQDLTRSGLPAYSVFCKPYASLGVRYRK